MYMTVERMSQQKLALLTFYLESNHIVRKLYIHTFCIASAYIIFYNFCVVGPIIFHWSLSIMKYTVCITGVWPGPSLSLCVGLRAVRWLWGAVSTRTGRLHSRDKRQFWMRVPGWSLGLLRRVPNDGSREERIALSCLSETIWALRLTTLASTPSS